MGVLVELPREKQSWPYVYGLFFIVGALAYAYQDLEVLRVGSLVLLLVASTAARHSVGTCAFEPSDGNPAAAIPAGFLEAANPRRTCRTLSLIHAVLISSLLGWLTYAALNTIPDQDLTAAGGRTVSVYVTALLALGRYLVYRVKLSPPVGFLARMHRGRMLLPGYDRIWIGPGVALATGLAALLLCSVSKMDTPTSVALAAAATVLPLIAVGPSLTEWDLTAKGHRTLIHQQWTRT